MSKTKRYLNAVTLYVFMFIFQCAFLSFNWYSIANASPEMPEIAADSYLLADLKTGRVFMSKDIDTPQVPASITKIMTLFIAFDEMAQGKLSFDDEVLVSEDAWRTEGSSMFLLVGTKVKVIELIQGMTVASGNDACVALAEHISGSVTSFVDRMNAQATSLGLTNTYFEDPNGLSDNNRVSASDLLVLVKEYMARYPQALQFHSLKEFTYAPPGENPITQFNRNTLLWSYPGVFGLKTGFTTLAGYNLIALADRDGFSTIAIILGSARGKSIDSGERERSALVTSMLDYAYKNFTYVKTAEPNADMGKVRIWKGKGKWVEAIAPTGLGATVEKGKEGQVTYEVVFDTDLEAPVQKGMRVGEAIFSCEGQEIGRTELTAKEQVTKGNLFRVVWDSIARSILRAFGKV